MVQSYRDPWARHSEMLAPLISLLGECGHEVHLNLIAFDSIKATIARDLVLANPDYSKEFEIYTDTLSKQLGAVITRGNKPIAFFISKVTETQQRFSVTKIELLAIGETLKEFKGMLWG